MPQKWCEWEKEWGVFLITIIYRPVELIYHLDQLVFRPDELAFKGYRTSSTIYFCMDQQMHLLRLNYTCDINLLFYL